MDTSGRFGSRQPLSRAAAILRGARAGTLSGWPFFVAFAFLGCESRPSDEGLVQKTAALTAVRGGSVHDSAGAPVAAAKIEVRSLDSRCLVARATTADDGSFELNVRSGTYDILVTPRSAFAPQRFPGQSLSRGSRLDLILISVQKIDLSGHVVDPRGNPIAQVNLCAGDTCSATDSTGAFAVTVDAGQSLHVSGSLGGGSFNLLMPIDGSQGPTLELRLPEIVVTGTVVDASGNPVPDATIGAPNCHAVSVDQFTGTACMPSYQLADAAGRFQFVTLPGEVDLVAIGTPGGYLSQSITQDTDVTIQTASLEVLSGRVVDRNGDGVPGQTVCARHNGCIIKGCAYLCTGTDDDGRYQLSAPAGSDSVDLSSLAGVVGHYFVSQVIALAQPTNLDFTLQNRIVTGQVLDPDGAPAPNVTVSAKSFTGDIDGVAADVFSTSQVTGQDGRFQLSFAAPGDTIVTAVGATSASVPVTLSADSDIVIQLGNLQPGNLGVASGQLLDGTGLGIAGATVYYSGSNPPRLVTATTDADGQYQLTLTPDAYSVTAQGTTAAGAIFTVSVDEPVVVPSAPLVIQLAPSRVVTGQLVAQDGNPLAGVAVENDCAMAKTDIGTESLCGSSQVSDASGRFTLDASLGASLSLTIDPLDQSGLDGLAVKGIVVGDDTDVTVAVQIRSRGPREHGP